MNLDLLASTIAYILGDAGPYKHLDHTNLTIEFMACWTLYDDDETLTYAGPTDVSVRLPLRRVV